MKTNLLRGLFVNLTFFAVLFFSVFVNNQNIYGMGGQEIVGTIEDNRQILNSVLEKRSYPDLIVQVGVPVKWVVDAQKENITSCNNSIVIREYELEYAFEPGENTGIVAGWE